ncbi:MAG: hypothetical protein GY708_06320 [Actinomycetia bacterium]|nr:hypothetical protein [Actinomycetes bacterium]
MPRLAVVEVGVVGVGAADAERVAVGRLAGAAGRLGGGAEAVLEEAVAELFDPAVA